MNVLLAAKLKSSEVALAPGTTWFSGLEMLASGVNSS